MRALRVIAASSLLLVLAACGGGGGSAGTTGAVGGGTGTGASSSVGTVLAVVLKNPKDGSSESIAAGGGSVLESTLTTKAGRPVPGQTITVFNSAANDLVVYPKGVTATTDSDGKARVEISRAALDRFGSVAVFAKFGGTVCEPSCSASVIQYEASDSEFLSVRADPPSLRMELRDASNQPTTSIGATGFTTVRASLSFVDGTAVGNKRIDVSGDPVRVSFPEGASQLTDSSGVASIKITRAGLNVNGAGSLTGSATLAGTTAAGSVESTVVSSVLDYQVGSANIALVNLNAGSETLPAFGNRAISVVANVNGSPATTTPVQVTFNASCGVVSPAVVTTNGSGVASTTYTANQAICSGSNVTISAAAIGSNSVSATIPVAASVATNIQFVSASPQLIYLRESVGTTQAQVIFRVVDSTGNPLQNKKLRLSLSNSSTGVSLDKVANTNSVDLSSNSQGLVSAAVYSGTVPTSLNVRATLLDANDAPTNVFSNSNLLTVASGRAVQRSLSLAFEKLSIEGLNTDGAETNVTLSMSDRQGNPVPPGTQVNFVTESGVMLPAVCFVPPVVPATASSPAIPTSYCTVKLRSQGFRPNNGLISVLAYLEGEEDFVDVNGDNVYNSGEPFTDLGRAYRDDNENGAYEIGEFQVPRASTAVCSAGAGCVGDGVWGAADVRAQGTIVFASGVAVISGTASTTLLRLNIADINGNSMPTGTDVVVDAGTPGSGIGAKCGAETAFNGKIANTLRPSAFNIPLVGCAPGGSLTVVVTSPAGLVNRQIISVD